MHQLYDRNLGANWPERVNDPAVWQQLYNVDPGELWETHNALKNRLLDFIRRRLVRDCLRRHEEDAAVEVEQLNPGLHGGDKARHSAECQWPGGDGDSGLPERA
jgi:hypothetical protein